MARMNENFFYFYFSRKLYQINSVLFLFFSLVQTCLPKKSDQVLYSTAPFPLGPVWSGTGGFSTVLPCFHYPCTDGLIGPVI